MLTSGDAPQAASSKAGTINTKDHRFIINLLFGASIHTSATKTGRLFTCSASILAGSIQKITINRTNDR
jgi:hypothetical protein